MDKVKFVGQKEVPIADLQPHPANPNRGSVPDIVRSLAEFGQYRSVVATKDLTLLAGHHVVEAAKSMGMTSVRVDIVDTDATTARKLMLADNRLADLGLGVDLELLLQNLEDLGGDLEGTGFDTEYLQLLEDAVNGPMEPDTNDDGPGDPSLFQRVSMLVDPRLAAQWASHRKLFVDDSSALGYLLGDSIEGER